MRLFFALLPALLAAGCALPENGDARLAESLSYEAYAAGRGTPAEYATNQIAGPPAARAKHLLLGKLSSPEPGALEQARELVKALHAEIRRGYEWPEKTPPEVEIPRAAPPPVIDGTPDEPAWEHALTFRGEYRCGSHELEPTGAVWKIMWDESYLYAAAVFPQANPVSEPYDPERGSAPWHADALELFAGTEARYRTYWEIVTSPDGSAYDALCWNNRYHWYLSMPEESAEGLRTAGKPTPQGYSVEIALPWRELPAYRNGNPPRAGEMLRFTMIRCRNGAQSACHPLLYGRHNIFGHLRGRLAGHSR